MKTTRHGSHVFIISLNRPEKRNAVDVETASLLTKSFKEFEDDTDARVAVLTGNGGTFCAGFDLSFLASTGASSNEDAIRQTVNGAATHLGPMVSLKSSFFSTEVVELSLTSS